MRLKYSYTIIVCSWFTSKRSQRDVVQRSVPFETNLTRKTHRGPKLHMSCLILNCLNMSQYQVRMNIRFTSTLIEPPVAWKKTINNFFTLAKSSKSWIIYQHLSAFISFLSEILWKSFSFCPEKLPFLPSHDHQLFGRHLYVELHGDPRHRKGGAAVALDVLPDQFHGLWATAQVPQSVGQVPRCRNFGPKASILNMFELEKHETYKLKTSYFTFGAVSCCNTPPVDHDWDLTGFPGQKVKPYLNSLPNWVKVNVLRYQK